MHTWKALDEVCKFLILLETSIFNFSHIFATFFIIFAVRSFSVSLLGACLPERTVRARHSDANLASAQRVVNALWGFFWVADSVSGGLPERWPVQQYLESTRIF